MLFSCHNRVPILATCVQSEIEKPASSAAAADSQQAKRLCQVCLSVNCTICDPVQQKGHHVGQVYSEIMSKTVCKI